MSQETEQTQPREEMPKAAKRKDLFDQLFTVWEKRTSEYFERLLRNPAFLSSMGGLMNTGYRNKAAVDRALGVVWRNLNLPNKQDQERTLHLLNELHSRIYDLEERLQRATDELERVAQTEQSEQPGQEQAKSRSRRTKPTDLRTAGTAE